MQKGIVFLLPILIVIALVGGGTVTVVASQNALPGDALYSVKTLKESVQIAITPKDKQADLYLKLADEKVQEMQKLQEKGADFEKITQANEEFQKYQQKAADLAGAISSSTDSQQIVQKLEESTQKQKTVLTNALTTASADDKEKLQQTIANSEQSSQKLVEDTRQKVEESAPSQTSSTASSSQTSQQTSIPTSTPNASTPAPTIVATSTPKPTAEPTATPNQSASLMIYAKDRNEQPNNPLYQGIVKVKNPTSGTVVASGITEPGYLQLNNISPGTYDVVLLKPSSYTTDICGDEQSVTLTAGNTTNVYMALKGIGASPCIRD